MWLVNIYPIWRHSFMTNWPLLVSMRSSIVCCNFEWIKNIRFRIIGKNWKTYVFWILYICQYSYLQDSSCKILKLKLKLFAKCQKNYQICKSYCCWWIQYGLYKVIYFTHVTLINYINQSIKFKFTKNWKKWNRVSTQM